MNWLDHVRLHGIAKHYAHELPKYLKDAYLDSEVYTRPQIDHAVQALKLPKEFVGLAYAAYLSKADFEAVGPSLPIAMDYEDARGEFFRHVPEPEPTSEWNPLSATILGRL